MSVFNQYIQNLRAAWRELGFFYEYDNKNARWRFIGSRRGLRNFCGMLRDCAAGHEDEQSPGQSRCSPYWYLKVMVGEGAWISEDGIAGSRSDLERLAQLMEEGLQSCAVGERFMIDAEYGEGNEAGIEVEVREEGFDPAGADGLLPACDAQQIAGADPNQHPS